jgi:ribonuclease Z
VKIQILGAGSGKPHRDYHLSATYIEFGGRKFLFDCGDGTYRALMEYGYDGNTLEAILISHYHPDHVSGIFMVLQMLYLQKRNAPLHLFLPERLTDFTTAMELFYTFTERFSFQLHLHLMPEIAGWQDGLFAIPTDHLTGYVPLVQKKRTVHTFHSYGLMLTEDGKQAILSSDLKSTQPLLPYIEGTDILIIDALHPNADDIWNLLPQIRKKLILSHGISLKLATLVEQQANPKVMFAQEFTEINL